MRRALPAVALAAAGIGVYLNGLGGPFLFDDLEAIVDNPQLRSLWPPWSAVVAPDESTLAGRPLPAATFALNYALGGLEVRGYHLVNVAIHVLCALALYGIVRRTLCGPTLGSRFGPASRALAFVVALTWTVHPLCTEAVDYIVQRTETLMACFYLLTLYCAIRSHEVPGGRLWSVAAVAACAAGMASKESMVSCPLVVLLHDRSYPGLAAAGPGRRRALYAGLAASWLVLAALIASGPRGASVGFGLGVGAWSYAKNQFLVIADYLRHVVWPHPLVFDYGFPVALELREVALEAALVSAALAAAACLWLWRPAAGFPALVFFVLLAPTSSVVPIVTEVGAERRMYLPLAAAVAGAVLAGHRALGSLSGPRRRAVAALAAVALVTALATATIRRNAVYGSAETVWRSAVQARPDNPRAHNGLGRVLYDAGRLDEAETAYRRALEIEPDYYQAQFNLGLVLADRGRPDPAIARFERAARLQPGRGEPHYRIAAVLARQGRTQSAIVELRRAVQLDPALADAHNDLGNALVAAGQVADGIDHLRRAIALRPDSALAHYNLALGLGSSGDVAGAIAENRAALALDPRQALAHNNLGTLLQAEGRVAEAVGCYRQALAIAPETVEAWANLGVALATLGRREEALGCLREALRLDPGSAPARRQLAQLGAEDSPRPQGDQ